MGVLINKMSKKKATPRDLQAAETREKIFNTACEMITEFGFDNVTVDDICRKAGVAKGLFYHYFNSKADIIIETYKELDKLYSQEIMALPQETDPLEKIIFAVSFQARYARARGPEFISQIYKYQIATGTRYSISTSRPFYMIIRETVIEGQEKNIIRADISPDELTRFLLSVARGIIYDWCLNKGIYDIEEQMVKFFRILAGSLNV